MTNKYIGEGNTVAVTAAADFTQGDIVPLSECAGVALNTGVTGETISVALEGVFTVTKKAGATLDFAQGEKVQTLTTGGVEKAVATGGSEALGVAWAAAATGDTEVQVKVCVW